MRKSTKWKQSDEMILLLDTVDYDIIFLVEGFFKVILKSEGFLVL